MAQTYAHSERVIAIEIGSLGATAPVAQGIEHRPPEAGAQVRILPGARTIWAIHAGGVHRRESPAVFSGGGAPRPRPGRAAPPGPPAAVAGVVGPLGLAEGWGVVLGPVGEGFGGAA